MQKSKNLNAIIIIFHNVQNLDQDEFFVNFYLDNKGYFQIGGNAAKSCSCQISVQYKRHNIEQVWNRQNYRKNCP